MRRVHAASNHGKCARRGHPSSHVCAHAYATPLPPTTTTTVHQHPYPHNARRAHPPRTTGALALVVVHCACLYAYLFRDSRHKAGVKRGGLHQRHGIYRPSTPASYVLFCSVQALCAGIDAAMNAVCGDHVAMCKGGGSQEGALLWQRACGAGGEQHAPPTRPPASPLCTSQGQVGYYPEACAAAVAAAATLPAHPTTSCMPAHPGALWQASRC